MGIADDELINITAFYYSDEVKRMSIIPAQPNCSASMLLSTISSLPSHTPKLLLQVWNLGRGFWVYFWVNVKDVWGLDNLASTFPGVHVSLTSILSSAALVWRPRKLITLQVDFGWDVGQVSQLVDLNLVWRVTVCENLNNNYVRDRYKGFYFCPFLM